MLVTTGLLALFRSRGLGETVGCYLDFERSMIGHYAVLAALRSEWKSCILRKRCLVT
jgi:hypothetical protein